MRLFKNGVGLGCWQLVTVLVLLLGWSWLAPPATGQNTKSSYKVGTVTEEKLTGEKVTHNIHYKDVHLKIATTGKYAPDPKVEKGGFTNGDPEVTPGAPDDCLTVDWLNDDAMEVVGERTIGVEFRKVGGGPNRVVRSYLTGVRIPTMGVVVAEYPVPGPTDLNTPPKKSKSVDWDFSFSDPALTGPVTFSSVEFYKTVAEPPLEVLNSTDFPLLPKIPLHVEPDFVLLPGAIHSVHVDDVDYPEWLIVNYITSWTDPMLTAIAGSPVTVDVTQWVAVQVVPEPSTLTLVGLGCVGLLGFARRRKPAATG